MAIILTVSLIHNIIRFTEANKKIDEARERVEELKREKALLEQKISFVRSEDYVEKEARDKLGLVYPGDTVIVLPDEETLKQLSPRVEIEDDFVPEANWKQWLNLFF